MPSCWRCTVTWLPNFLVWVDLLIHGAPQARFARQSSANKTSSYICYFKDFEIHIWCVFIYSLHTSNNWGSKAFEAQSKLLFGDFLQRYPMKFWSRSWNTPLWGRLWPLCAVSKRLMRLCNTDCLWQIVAIDEWMIQKIDQHPMATIMSHAEAFTYFSMRNVTIKYSAVGLLRHLANSSKLVYLHLSWQD